MRLGLVVNPLAGIGGPAAAKGSDSEGARLLADGAAATAPARAKRFLAAVNSDVAWVAAPGAMGASALAEADVAEPTLVLADETFELGTTTADDTKRVCQALATADVDLVCFLGGDGTATDVANTLGPGTPAGGKGGIPCLGIPAGVKITSPVFAHDLDEAAWLVNRLAPGFECTVRDVTDLDEDAYRDGRLDTHLTGALRVPLSPAVQGGKVATTVETDLEGLVEQVLRDWDADAVWLVGAGAVCRAVKAQFWGEPTLLGVDAISGNRLVANDLAAHQVRQLVAESQAAGKPVRILLSLIGGQGVLLGRGTQVLPPDALAAIGWSHIHIAAPPEKLVGLRSIHIDSGDPAFDAAAPDFLRITCGYGETRMVRVAKEPPA